MAEIGPVTTRPLARRVATVLPARSICDNSQPPKISPCGLASAGIAMARSAGSDCGGASVASLALIGSPSRWRKIFARPLDHRLGHLIEPVHDRLQIFSGGRVEHEILLLHQ